MGLDMYLYAERYVSGYLRDEKDTYAKLVGIVGLDKIASRETPNATVRTCVAYWRKANHIHNWFVQNVQDGKDECQDAYVTREQLIELRDTCQRVLDEIETKPGTIVVGQRATPSGEEKEDIIEEGDVVVDPTVAERLLPTTSGFFFGGTDYDEFYLMDVKSTIEQVDRVLANAPKDVDFYYQSSW